MSETKAQIAALQELHGDPGAAIKRLLDGACQHDAAARAMRKRAGRLLAELRSEHPRDWKRLAGVDARLADMLLDMGAGKR